MSARSDRVVWVLLVGFALAVPLSIAVSQGLAVLAMLVWAGERLVARKIRFERTPLDLPIICFVAVALGSVLWGVDKGTSLKGFRTYGLILIIYLVYAHVRDLRQLRQLVLALLAGMTIDACLKVWQVMFVMRIVPEHRDPWGIVMELGSMSQAGQLLVAIGLALALMMRERRLKWLIRLGMALFVMTAAAMVVGLWVYWQAALAVCWVRGEGG